MGHDIGLVFLRPEADLEETLAPFNEQDEKYMVFVDKTDEVKEAFDKLPDSCPSEGTYIEEINQTDRVNDNWAHQASKEKYPTLDAYVKDYYGYKRVDGRYGYFSNPNAKYDWYIEGGRWDGYLTNSEGAKTNREMLMEVDWEKTDVLSHFVNADGEWCEKGKLGWFGMTTNEKPKEDWNAKFKDYVRTLIADEEAEEIQVVAIDFHI
jgi:hypothetical protein